MMTDRLSALRKVMQRERIDIYYIGSEDYHGSEYVGGHFRGRAWLSGFTGSAGTLIVTADRADLWTDGRYFLQAEQQLAGSGITLRQMLEKGVPTIPEYLKDTLQPGQTLAFDGRCIGSRTGEQYREIARACGACIRADFDPLEEIWEDRPALAERPAWLYDLSYCGVGREDKLARIRKAIREAGADFLVLSSLDDIAWLLNIRGDDVMDNPVALSYLILTEAQAVLYISEKALDGEVRTALEKAGVTPAPYSRIYEDLRRLSPDLKVLLDKGSVSYAVTAALPEGITVIDRENPTRLPKAIKNPTEVAGFRKAHLKDGIALTKFMYWLKTNVGRLPMTEISAAEKMETFRKAQENYLEPSFEPISGYAEHAAIVHYSATEESNAQILPKGMLLMDTGAQYMEGTTDITRTFVLGEITEEERKFFTLVLRANLDLGGVKFRYGCTGLNLDYVARAPLWQEGLDYNHGTGHGVGCLLNVHEGPNAFRWRLLPGQQSAAVFEEGMVTSNEPGYYREGAFGIRHENLMVCVRAEETAYGQFMAFDTLTLVPFDLDGVDPALLTAREKQLLNDYHKRIYDSVGPYLEPEELTWLQQATRPI